MSSSKHIVDLRRKRPGRGSREGQLQLPQGRRRRPPLRSRRRRARLILALALLVFAGIAAAGVSYASYLPAFNVQAVLVSGAQSTPPSGIEKLAYDAIEQGPRSFLSRSNIFLYHPRQVAAAVLAQFPRLKSAAVSRPSLFSTTVVIAVSERQPFALWCEGGASSSPCYDMDDTGFLFEPHDASTTLASGYVFSGGVAASADYIGATFAPGHFQGILALLRLLLQDGFGPAGAHVEDDQDFTVPLGAFYLKASFGENAETVAKNLQLILSSDALSGKESQLEYVDLRFGDRVYYKFNGQSATSAP